MAPLVQSPIYNTLRHLPEEQIRWKVAVYHAQNETREAPWYPAWDHTARKLDCIEYRELSITVPLICSQQPITFEIDAIEELSNNDHEPSTHGDDAITLLSTHSIDDQAATLEVWTSDASSSIEGISSDEFGSPKPHPFTPKSGSGLHETPQRPSRLRATGPSFINNIPTTPIRPNPPTNYPYAQCISNMELFPISSPLPPSSEPSEFGIRYNRSPPRPLEGRLGESLLSSSPSSPSPGPFVSNTDYLTNDEKRTLVYANKLRSTRIPDLLRRVFKLWRTGEASIFDLIIEIKKADFLLTNSLDALRRQILTQAEHVFAADPMVQSIGCILAIGDRWRYEEVYRPIINTAISAMETDPDYVQQTSDPHTSSTGYHSSWSGSNPNTIPSDNSPLPNRLPHASVLGQIFTGDSSFMISICHADSDKLLAAIYERLKALNPSYWSDDGDEQDSPRVISFRSQFDMDADEYSDEGDDLGDVIHMIQNEDSDIEYESEEDA